MLKGYAKAVTKKIGLKKGYLGGSDSDMPTLAEPSTIVSFDEDDLPEIKDWKVGKTYKLALEVEQTGIRKKNEYGYRGGENDNEMSATFKVKSVKAI